MKSLQIKINLILSITILVIGLSSCDLGGVKNTDETDTVMADDSSGLSTDEYISEVGDNEPDYALLNDSISGQPNDMVFQREDGLRVEWTKKNDDPIQLNDVVMVNYKARVAVGDQYDSNEEIGEPVPIKSNTGMMVEGWEEGLLQMNVGDEGRIMIPAALGYGEDGLSDIVPPDADLIVDIEIVDRVEPIVLDEGVKVYTWKKNKNGSYPTKNQVITFDYFAYTTGKDAHLYDNSFQNREPFSFTFENDNVMDGLHQGFSVIKSDENAFIEIPAKLAYGSKGLVDLVPKNTDVVYDVRVMRVE